MFEKEDETTNKRERDYIVTYNKEKRDWVDPYSKKETGYSVMYYKEEMDCLSCIIKRGGTTSTLKRK